MSLELSLELMSAILTILVMSYLFFGNKFFFRLASYSFVGVASGYVLVLIIFQVLWPRLVLPLLQGNLIVAVFPLLLGILLLFKLIPRLSSIGNISMAFIVGVGAAVAIGGAVFGTLLGQIGGALVAVSPHQTNANAMRVTEGFFVLLGTICTLAYFQFSASNRRNQPVRRARIVEWMGWVGQAFIGITLGAVFAGVLAASISALIERIGFVINFIVHLAGGG